MIDGKALFAPSWGKPCECIVLEDDECDCDEPTPLTLVEARGQQWIVNPFHASVMLRADAVDLSSLDTEGWGEWMLTGLNGAAAVERFSHARPKPERTSHRFHRGLVEAIYATGCSIWPSNFVLNHSSQVPLHVVMHGEDYIGWIMPADPAKVSEDSDLWCGIPS